MISKEVINKLPSSLRDELSKYLKQCVDRAERQRTDAALSFAVTTDETQRASSLIAQGEFNAFMALYNVFK